MQVEIDVTCMHASFGGRGFFGFGDMTTFQKQPNFPFGAWTTEIVEHIDLPQSAILFYGGGNKLDLPPHLISSEVKILTMEIEESIVATSILEEEEAQSLRHYENTPSIPLVDIPVDLGIEVV